MFVNFGRRKLRIKRYSDNFTACPECKSIGLEINVFKEYFHICYIPFFPNGIKTSSIYCTNCQRSIRHDSLLRSYENSAKIPLYLYSGLLFIGCLFISFIYFNTQAQKDKKRFVLDPQKGDVYLVRKDSDKATQYFFLRVNEIQGDSVFTNHSNLVYNGYTSKFDVDDFFVENEELGFSKPELLRMLHDGEINSVERDYDDETGFYRIK